MFDNKQRMDYQQCDLLFQQHTVPAAQNSRGRYAYRLNYDLPMQIAHHPFFQSRQHPANHQFYQRKSHVISKCALTQTSRTNQNDDQSITPICQKLFPHHQSHIWYGQQIHANKELDIPPTLSSQQLVTEATFKPADLQGYLRGAQGGDCSRLKEILRQKVLIRPSKQQKQPRSRAASSQIEGIKDKLKQKTKYQMILQEFFNGSRVKKEVTKQHLNNKCPKQHYVAKSSCARQSQDILRNCQKTTNNQINRSKSEKNISVQPHNLKTGNKIEKPLLVKTFEMQQLKQERNSEKRKETSGRQETNEGWMKMSFEKRQARTIQNRRNKENQGQHINQQKEMKGCTFKPTIFPFKPFPQPQAVGGSYAKQYLERIRQRL